MIGKRDVHPNINIGSDNVDKASTYDVQDHDVQDHLKVLFQKNHLPSNLFEPSIPYRKPKEHPLYARSFPFYCVRAYRPCTDVRSDWSETRNIGGMQSKRQDTTSMVIPCLYSFLFTIPSSASAGTCRGEAPPSCYARPFCCLKSPLGLSLLRYTPQPRTSCKQKTYPNPFS